MINAISTYSMKPMQNKSNVQFGSKAILATKYTEKGLEQKEVPLNLNETYRKICEIIELLHPTTKPSGIRIPLNAAQSKELMILPKGKQGKIRDILASKGIILAAQEHAPGFYRCKDAAGGFHILTLESDGFHEIKPQIQLGKTSFEGSGYKTSIKIPDSENPGHFLDARVTTPTKSISRGGVSEPVIEIGQFDKNTGKLEKGIILDADFSNLGRTNDHVTVESKIKKGLNTITAVLKEWCQE